MNYQVWTKEEFGETYTKVDCGDLPAAKREIDLAYKNGKDPTLTVEVPYSLAIKVEAVGTEKPQRVGVPSKSETKEKEASKSEADQGKTEADKGPGTEGKGQV